MSLFKIIIVIAIIAFFLYMMKKDRYPSDEYVVPNNGIDTPSRPNTLIETNKPIRSSTEFAPYVTQPNDSRYVFVPNLGVYLLPYEHLNLSIPYHQWMYSHFPSYYGEYYDNYWPFDDSVAGAKYINSFDNAHWSRRQGNRENRQGAGRYWDRVGGDPDHVNGNRWSSYDNTQPRGRCSSQ